MPISGQLLRDGRVYLFTYAERFTVNEIGESVEALQQEVLAHAARKVHTISDFSAVRSLPPNSLGSSRHLVRRSHPMLGTVILVTPSDFIRRMIDIMTKVTPGSRLITCRTLDDALAEVDRILAEESQQEESPV